ncbi:hypothetical protein Acj9p115 [Acinetobacter phage Acj9]|uniref:Uncharacterized protein a-gt.4 n=1 Tax=Acinetobacter phage Acj9 TaxID=760939 RepID=E5EPP9_9CAUD|nr:hypothetical protein Acj9p115 [Acinetobacter phage Acj9]ADG60015.1 conserved hypothetical protein [Acinetobacter phage Acj9]
MNIEQLNVETEARDAIDAQIAEEDRLDYEFEASKIQTRIEADAKRQAEKILKKNKREIARLKKHAEQCVLTGNYFGYQYAVKKLRDFYKQPYTEQLIRDMWTSSRGAIVDIMVDAIEKAKQA